MICDELRHWKLIATLAVLVTVISACGGGRTDEVGSPTDLPVQPIPNADVVATQTPAEKPTVVTIPTNTPVFSPTVQATPIITLSQVEVKPDTDEKIAEVGDAIAVHYTGTLDNGDVFDTSRDGDPPLEFMLGSGQMIPGFEKAVRGMAIGEIKKIRLSPNDAYGELDDDLILEMPREGAPVGLQVGDSVRLANGMPVTIIEITNESVVIDANHRLAGQALTFEIEIMSIN